MNYSNVQVEPFNSTPPAYIDHRVYTLFNDSFFNEPDFRIMYAIQWLIYEVYHVYVQLPQFPIALKYPPTLGMPSI
ncbi:hypothetical protein [Thermogymnomonas acidicola]|uniref:hypothetical protein n=1 Tax=Thermogymnomonas acidicola TaxID=399579 RepID=UPI0009461EFA|nr:hypothetical protein [Thermogymnomonas acidicola]